MKYYRYLWYIVLALNLAFIMYFWWQGSGYLLSQGLDNVYISLGRLSGLLAAFMVLLQFFFMGRTPYLERVFGLDKLARIHQATGKGAFYFLLAHPILLTMGYSGLAQVGLVTQFQAFLTGYEDVLEALLGLVLFLVVIILSITIVRRRLKYEYWYFVHLSVYLAVFFSFGHQFHVGTDIILSKVFYAYWIGLYIVVFGHHALFRFLKPLYNFYEHQFYVDRVINENENVVSIYIKGRNLSTFAIRPGQFMIFRFLDTQRWWQAHPFSLSKPMDGNSIRVTPKQLGDFTRELSTLKAGTKVIIDGPYGIFTEKVATTTKFLLIAGGIGITPIRSLAESLVAQGKDVLLLYGNRNQKEIVFKEELQSIFFDKQKLIDVMSEESEYVGEKGRIDEEKIKRLVPDFKERDIYICGPPPMMDGLVALCKTLGVPDNQIHFEKFSL